MEPEAVFAEPDDSLMVRPRLIYARGLSSQSSSHEANDEMYANTFSYPQGESESESD